MLCYYHDFIDKCLEVHGIDLTTIISDCVTAGYESRADEVIELRARLDQKVSRKMSIGNYTKKLKISFIK